MKYTIPLRSRSRPDLRTLPTDLLRPPTARTAPRPLVVSCRSSLTRDRSPPAPLSHPHGSHQSLSHACRPRLRTERPNWPNCPSARLYPAYPDGSTSANSILPVVVTGTLPEAQQEQPAQLHQAYRSSCNRSFGRASPLHQLTHPPKLLWYLIVICKPDDAARRHGRARAGYGPYGDGTRVQLYPPRTLSPCGPRLDGHTEDTPGCVPNFSFQVDSTPDARMDGWKLQRCASRSAAGADGLPRSARDRVRCLRCIRVNGRCRRHCAHVKVCRATSRPVCRSHCTDCPLLARAAESITTPTGIDCSIGPEQLDSSAVRSACRRPAIVGSCGGHGHTWAWRPHCWCSACA